MTDHTELKKLEETMAEPKFKDYSLEKISLTEFLILAFESLTEKLDPERHLVFFTSSPELIHRTWMNMQRKHRNTFPVLDKMSFFGQGEFPLCSRLSDALQRLITEGHRLTIKNAWCFEWSPDSGSVLDENLGELLGQDAELQKAFSELVLFLKALVVHSPINGELPPNFHPTCDDPP